MARVVGTISVDRQYLGGKAQKQYIINKGIITGAITLQLSKNMPTIKKHLKVQKPGKALK